MITENDFFDIMVKVENALEIKPKITKDFLYAFEDKYFFYDQPNNYRSVDLLIESLELIMPHLKDATALFIIPEYIGLNNYDINNFLNISNLSKFEFKPSFSLKPADFNVLGLTTFIKFMNLLDNRQPVLNGCLSADDIIDRLVVDTLNVGGQTPRIMPMEAKDFELNTKGPIHRYFNRIAEELKHLRT